MNILYSKYKIFLIILLNNTYIHVRKFQSLTMNDHRAACCSYVISLHHIYYYIFYISLFSLHFFSFLYCLILMYVLSSLFDYHFIHCLYESSYFFISYLSMVLLIYLTSFLHSYNISLWPLRNFDISNIHGSFIP